MGLRRVASVPQDGLEVAKGVGGKTRRALLTATDHVDAFVHWTRRILIAGDMKAASASWGDELRIDKSFVREVEHFNGLAREGKLPEPQSLDDVFKPRS